MDADYCWGSCTIILFDWSLFIIFAINWGPNFASLLFLYQLIITSFIESRREKKNTYRRNCVINTVRRHEFVIKRYLLVKMMDSFLAVLELFFLYHKNECHVIISCPPFSIILKIKSTHLINNNSLKIIIYNFLYNLLT